MMNELLQSYQEDPVKSVGNQENKLLIAALVKTPKYYLSGK
jgi:hypothetical protein